MTSLAHAFVHAIIPRDDRLAKQQQLFEAAGINPAECVYCGVTATDQDHFRGLVKGGRPSGHFHIAENVVPACGPCNQSKGAAAWQKWLVGNAKGSPKRRGIRDIDAREARLKLFEDASTVKACTEDEMKTAAGAELWESYWAKLEDVKRKLLEAEADATQIRQRLEEVFLNKSADKL